MLSQPCTQQSRHREDSAAEPEQNANSRVLQASDVPPTRVAIESLTCFGTAALRVQRLKYVPGSKSQLKDLRPKG